jgi:hypothetical protein
MPAITSAMKNIDRHNLEPVIKLVLKSPLYFESVIPTGAQRSGGIRCLTHAASFGREAGFSTAPLTVKL